MYFDKSCILSTDDIFLKCFKKSGLKHLMSRANMDLVYNMTVVTSGTMVENFSKTKPYTVFDAIGFDTRVRLNLILTFHKLYSNVILLVLQPPFEKTKKYLSNREKNHSMKSIGLTTPTSSQLHKTWEAFENEIKTKGIAKGADITYVIRDPDSVTLTIE